MRAFLDTNVLLYAASDDPEKASRVERCIRSGGTISVQVLNEALRVFRTKWRRDWEVTRRFLERCEQAFDVVPLDLATHRLGAGLAERYNFAPFDAMIVAAALQAGCDTLYSEDMQHGLLVDGTLTIRNPFAT